MDDEVESGAAYSCAADLYIIAWRDRDTGREGHGTSRFPFAAAESLCAELNKENPSFQHWPEPEKERVNVEVAQG